MSDDGDNKLADINKKQDPNDLDKSDIVDDDQDNPDGVDDDDQKPDSNDSNEDDERLPDVKPDDDNSQKGTDDDKKKLGDRSVNKDDDNPKTMEEQAIANKREIRKLKEQNAKMRAELKELNQKLTDTIERLRVRTLNKSKSSKNTELTLEKALTNSHKQIKLYEQELGFLEIRVQEGDQIDRIQSLQEELYQKQKDEDQLKKQVSKSSKILKKSEKLLESSLNERSHKERVTFLMNESKFLKNRIKKIEEHMAKEGETFEKQKAFLSKLEDRYKELCSKVNKEMDLEFEFDEAGNTKIKYIGEKQPQAPKKTKIGKVSEYWKNDHPDKFEVIMNQKHFDELKERVLTMKRSNAIKNRQHNYKINTIDENLSSMEKEEKNIESKLKEKEKELELLMKQLEHEKKGIKHGSLLPIEEVIRLKELENDQGEVIINVGKCTTLIKKGEQELFGDNPRVKLRAIKFWVEKQKIIGAQAEYSPHFDVPLYGKKNNKQPKILGFYKYQITGFSSVADKDLLCVSWDTKSGDNYSIGDADAKGESSSLEVPPYSYIKTAYFYGDNVKITGFGLQIIH